MVLLTLLTILLTLQSASSDCDECYYDITNIPRGFSVDCGIIGSPRLQVTYSGRASAMYSVQNPAQCVATEVAPEVLALPDAVSSFECPFDYKDRITPLCTLNGKSKSILYPQMLCRHPSPGHQQFSDTDPTLYMEVAVQMGLVRQSSDTVYRVECVYTNSGKVDSQKDAEQGYVEILPVVSFTGESDARSDIWLVLYGVSDEPETEVALGDYVQLRAFMRAQGEETSLSIRNCRASSATKQYYFLLNGCGDGIAFHSSRGFLTRSEVELEAQNITRVARSAYFKMFIMDDAEMSMHFECDFLVCTDTSCDGRSCDQPYFRQRRSVDQVLPRVHTATVSVMKSKLPMANVVRIGNVLDEYEVQRRQEDIEQPRAEYHHRISPASLSSVSPTDAMPIFLCVCGLCVLLTTTIVVLWCFRGRSWRTDRYVVQYPLNLPEYTPKCPGSVYIYPHNDRVPVNA